MTRAELWAYLDALELYETWVVKELPENLSAHRASNAYNIRSDPARRGEMTMKEVDDGYLFVRVR